MPNGLLVGALRAQESLKSLRFFAGEAGLLGACSHFSDTLLERSGSCELFALARWT